METVDLKLDEKNEIEFKLEIESSEQVGAPTARLMCEAGGLSYAFNGEITSDGEVKVIVPSMKGRLDKGNYKATLEVFVDNKYFVPLEFQANFKESIKVMAEVKTKTRKSQSTVKAAIVSKTVTESDTLQAKKTLKEQVEKKKKLEEQKKCRVLAAKKKKLEEQKKKLAAKKRKLLEQKKRKPKTDVELSDLLEDLGIED